MSDTHQEYSDRAYSIMREIGDLALEIENLDGRKQESLKPLVAHLENAHSEMQQFRRYIKADERWEDE